MIIDVEIFSKSLSVLVEPLKKLSHTGFQCDGYILYPLFYCYVTDYPEGSKVN